MDLGIGVQNIALTPGILIEQLRNKISAAFGIRLGLPIRASMCIGHITKLDHGSFLTVESG
jgi:hypothetical protein